MAYHRPRSVEAAVALLAAKPESRCLAGGATLVALMNARLVAPASLVSLKGIAELREAGRAADGGMRIGAMRRHAETAADDRLQGGQSVLRLAAGQIANPVVRNMGTLGGSIAFADPAADYPPALVCADAEIELAGEKGRRRIPARDFFTGWYETALAPGEIVTAILLPPSAPGSHAVYDKLARVSGDFAIVSVAVILVAEDGLCRNLRVAIGGCGPAPVRRPEIEAELRGRTLDALDTGRLGAALADSCDPVDDVRASAEYRRRVVPRMVARAVARACARPRLAA